jgi:hypothetical protein
METATVALRFSRSGFGAHRTQGVNDGAFGDRAALAAMSKERYQCANRSAVAAPMRASAAMALGIMAWGPGRISLDHLIDRLKG